MNEYLFWKVFHNKFLFNKIIQQIHNTEWVIYDDHSQLHINNRSKFKDTHSLDIMIKNKLFTLLNYKLDNNKYIQIEKVSPITLFYQLSSIPTNNNSMSSNSNNNNNNINTLKEILIKLLEKRRDEFEITDLTFTAVACNSLDALRILTNESYSIPIYPSTLKYAIKHCHPIMVDEILRINSNNYLDRNNNEIFNKIKEKSFNYISKNIKFKNEMVEYILYNFNLPPPPSTTSTTTESTTQEEEEEEQPKKKLKLSNTTTTTTTTSRIPELSTLKVLPDNKETASIISTILAHKENSEINNESIKLPSIELITPIIKYSIIRIPVLFKFLISRFKDLNLVDIPYDDTLSLYKLIKIEPINQDDEDSKLSLKELQKLIIIKLKNGFDDIFENEYLQFYKSYIRKYKELINECHDIDEESDEESDEEEACGSTDDGILKFKQFFKIIKIFKCIDDDDEDDDEIDEYKVLKDCNKGKLVWNELLFNIATNKEDQGRVVINDRSTIDWILNCKNESILWFIIEQFNKITVSTLELANYVYLESGLIKHLNEIGNNNYFIDIYHKVWNEAIKQSDFNTIQNIESSLNHMIDTSLSKLTEYSKLTTNDQTIKLINYLNNVAHFNKFNAQCYFKLFYHLIGKSGIEYYSNLNLNFNINDKENIEELIAIFKDAMVENRYKLVELLLNSNLFNNIEIIDKEKFSIYFNYFNRDSKFIFNSSGVITHNREKSNDTGTESGKIKIIEIIKKILNKQPTTSTTTGNKMEINNPISVMVNYYFSLLIQIKGITMDEVKEVYELITQQHSIIIEHDLYHLFYYLHIKDIKFTRYLTSFYFLSIYFQTNGREDYYDCREYIGNDKDESWIYLEDYLKSSEFTFQLIYNQSFDTVLQMIIDSLSPLLFNGQFNNPDKFNKHLNWELEFYLIIKRQDLFFKKLEFIKNLLNIENEKDQNNPTSYKSNLFSKTVILFNSPSTTLLPTSTLFNEVNNDITPPPPTIPLKFIENIKKYEFQPIEPLAYTFEISHKVIEAICKVLELNEIIQVIKFHYYQPEFQFTLLYITVIQCIRFDITKLIFDNFDLSLLNFKIFFFRCRFESLSFILNNYFNQILSPFKFESNSIENHLKLFKLKYLQLLENFFQHNQDILNQFISPSTSFEIKYQILFNSFDFINSLHMHNNSSNNNIYYKCSSDGDTNKLNTSTKLIELYYQDEYQSIFKNLFDSFLKKIQKYEIENCLISEKTYNEKEDNIFLRSFINGDIKLCELILSFYQQSFNFKISNQSITQTIQNDNIHIIIYFLKNHINLFSNDTINHLKSELENHKNYKYLNLFE